MRHRRRFVGRAATSKPEFDLLILFQCHEHIVQLQHALLANFLFDFGPCCVGKMVLSVHLRFFGAVGSDMTWHRSQRYRHISFLHLLPIYCQSDATCFCSSVAVSAVRISVSLVRKKLLHRSRASTGGSLGKVGLYGVDRDETLVLRRRGRCRGWSRRRLLLSDAAAADRATCGE